MTIVGTAKDSQGVAVTDLVPVRAVQSSAALSEGENRSGPTESTQTSRRTRLVLDTSVLIADPACIVGFGDVDVVIPLTVIEELDGLKSRPDDVGRSARAALRAIEDLRVRNG